LNWSNPSLAPFVPTPITVVREMLTLADVKPGEKVYDLGCGDGRILVVAAQEFGAEAVGVELNMERVKEGRDRISALGLNEKVKIVYGNIFDVDVSPADVVTLYLTTSGNEKLRPKLEKELRGGARIISHDFTIPGWKIHRVERVPEDYRVHTLYLYLR